MMDKCRVKYCLPGSAETNFRMIQRGLTVADAIAFVAKMYSADLTRASLDGTFLAVEEGFDDYHRVVDINPDSRHLFELSQK
jgi:hypothetical protein